MPIEAGALPKFISQRQEEILRESQPEDSIQTRQRPAEVNTVLATAAVCSGNEIATLTEHQKALHTAKQKELLNIGKFGVVKVVDRPQSQQVLPTRWVQKQRLDGSHKMRIVGRGFELTVSPDADFFAGTPKLTTLRGLSMIAVIHWNPVAFGDFHSINHQCRANQYQCVWSQRWKHF